MNLRTSLASAVAAATIALTATTASAAETGVYVGAYGGYNFTPGPDGMTFGVLGGYSFSTGKIAVAGEIRTGVTNIGGLMGNSDINLRVGFQATDMIMVYGVAGLGANFTIDLPYWNVGAGVEFSMANGMGIFAEYRRAYLVGGGPTFLGNAILAGIHIHR